MKGFEQELGQKVAEEIITLVREMSRYLPLNNLVGVMVAYDYDAALANIDRGFGGAAPPAQATHDDELGHGTAMAVSVNRDGVWKTHVVFGPYVVGLLASNNENDKASAPTQTDGSGWSEASRRSAGQLGESPVCICALGATSWSRTSSRTRPTMNLSARPLAIFG